MSRPSIIVILGPTATGKSDLAVSLAKKLNGEVISADSRQVFKGLDIGTGKITKKEMKGIPHHLIDVVSPKSAFSVDHFQKMSYAVIDDIVARGKMPIVCGGTGFYIQSIVDGIILPEVKANKELRAKLIPLKVEKLFAMLRIVDPKRAAKIDPNNKVRIIRALEIAKELGASPVIKARPRYRAAQFGIRYSDDKLKARIHARLIKRVNAGMIEEAKKLHEQGLTYKRMESLGLEYRYLAYYLQKKISKVEMIRQLDLLIWQYAKRQMTWFKRDPRITWIDIK